MERIAQDDRVRIAVYDPTFVNGFLTRGNKIGYINFRLLKNLRGNESVAFLSSSPAVFVAESPWEYVEGINFVSNKPHLTWNGGVLDVGYGRELVALTPSGIEYRSNNALFTPVDRGDRVLRYNRNYIIQGNGAIALDIIIYAVSEFAASFAESSVESISKLYKAIDDSGILTCSHIKYNTGYLAHNRKIAKDQFRVGVAGGLVFFVFERA